MIFFTRICFAFFLVLNLHNCSKDSVNLSFGQVVQPGGRGAVRTDCVSSVVYGDLFSANAEFKENDIVQSSIGFGNLKIDNDPSLEITDDWVVAGDSLPFIILVEFNGGDVIEQTYQSAPGSRIQVVHNVSGLTSISFDSLLLLKDTRFHNAPQSSDSLLFVEGSFQFILEL